MRREMPNSKAIHSWEHNVCGSKPTKSYGKRCIMTHINTLEDSAPLQPQSGAPQCRAAAEQAWELEQGSKAAPQHVQAPRCRV